MKKIFSIFIFCIALPFRFIIFIANFYTNHIESVWLTMDDFVKMKIILKIESYDYIENYKIKYHCIPFRRNNIKIILFLKESNHILNVLLNNKNIFDLEEELNSLKSYAYVGKIKVIIKYLPELE